METNCYGYTEKKGLIRLAMESEPEFSPNITSLGDLGGLRRGPHFSPLNYIIHGRPGTMEGSGNAAPLRSEASQPSPTARTRPSSFLNFFSILHCYRPQKQRSHGVPVPGVVGFHAGQSLAPLNTYL